MSKLLLNNLPWSPPWGIRSLVSSLPSCVDWTYSLAYSKWNVAKGMECSFWDWVINECMSTFSLACLCGSPGEVNGHVKSYFMEWHVYKTLRATFSQRSARNQGTLSQENRSNWILPTTMTQRNCEIINVVVLSHCLLGLFVKQQWIIQLGTDWIYHIDAWT